MRTRTNNNKGFKSFDKNSLRRLAKFHKIPNYTDLKHSARVKAVLRYEAANFFNTPRIKRLIVRLPKVYSILYDIDIEHSEKLLKYFIKYFEKSVKNRGINTTLRLLKVFTTIATRFSCGHSFEIPEDQLVKLSLEGIPLRLIPFKDDLLGSIDQKRFALAILNLPRLIIVDGPFDKYSSITEKSRFEQLSLNEQPKLGGYFQRIIDNSTDPLVIREVSKIKSSFIKTVEVIFPLKDQLKRILKLKKLSKLHVSPKNGPNGPCIGASLLDYKSLKNNPELLGYIKWFSSFTANKRLNNILDSLEKSENFERSLIKHECYDFLTSKIKLKKESWDKRRAFAIADWFSQSALVGLHDYLNDVLKTFQEDCSFNQTYAVRLIQYWTQYSVDLPEFQVNSIDLTTATDRIPSEVQAEILSQAFGSEFAFNWRNILCNREFNSPIGNIRYSTGQPMGMKSSWTMLALWHNVCCRTAHKMCGIQLQPEPKYCVIGDDVTLRGQSLYESYLKIIHYQGVPISKSKGFHPETIDRNSLINQTIKSHSAEMAKCVVFNGHVVTTVAPGTLLASLENPKDFTSLLWDLKLRDHKVPSLESVLDLSNLGYKPRLCRLYASSPLNPVPTISEVQGDLEVISNTWLRDTGWYYSNNLPVSFTSLEVFANVSLRKRAIALLKIDRQMIKKYNTFKSADLYLKVGKHGYTKPTDLNIIYHNIGKQISDGSMQIQMGELSKILTSSKLLKYSDLKSLISRLSTSFDIDLTIQKKDKRLSVETVQSRLTGEILKNINQSISSTESNGTSILLKYLNLEEL